MQAVLERWGGPLPLFEASRAELESLGLRRTAIDFIVDPDPSLIEPDLAWLAEEGNHLVTLNDPAYPALLREIADAPALLYLRGDPAMLGELQLAVVGSRTPTAGGRRAAYDFARHLGGAGLVITSGLALGVDAAAHEGALDGGGRTVAVVGTGLDRVYPARHRELAHRIAERGALVSEFPVGVGPRPEHFPRRNRIISGLSLGTLVVEAAVRSGSLITARLAAEQGREVFAIPGSIHNPLARGCHGLIRQGAKLVEQASDILEELGQLAGVALAVGAEGAAAGGPETGGGERDGEYGRLLDCLGFDPLSMDRLVACSGLTAEAVSSMLLVLELDGQVESLPGGTYFRTPHEEPQ
ncbi:DNA-processing protein DprA [Endothiovibrio diazotrophicus]